MSTTTSTNTHLNDSGLTLSNLFEREEGRLEEVATNNYEQRCTNFADRELNYEPFEEGEGDEYNNEEEDDNDERDGL